MLPLHAFFSCVLTNPVLYSFASLSVPASEASAAASHSWPWRQRRQRADERYSRAGEEKHKYTHTFTALTRTSTLIHTTLALVSQLLLGAPIILRSASLSGLIAMIYQSHTSTPSHPHAHSQYFTSKTPHTCTQKTTTTFYPSLITRLVRAFIDNLAHQFTYLSIPKHTPSSRCYRAHKFHVTHTLTHSHKYDEDSLLLSHKHTPSRCYIDNLAHQFHRWPLTPRTCVMSATRFCTSAFKPS